jgi:hypothetical protein
MNDKRRNDIVEAITTELHGVEFVALALFKDDRLVDEVTRKPKDNDGGFSVILEAIVLHEMGPVELRTDSEELFRQTVTISGILGRLVSREELSMLYRQFTPSSDIYPVLCDVYELDDGSKLEPKQIGRVARIINRAKQWLLTKLNSMRGRFL